MSAESWKRAIQKIDTAAQAKADLDRQLREVKRTSDEVCKRAFNDAVVELGLFDQSEDGEIAKELLKKTGKAIIIGITFTLTKSVIVHFYCQDGFRVSEVKRVVVGFRTGYIVQCSLVEQNARRAEYEEIARRFGLCPPPSRMIDWLKEKIDQVAEEVLKGR